MRSPVANHQQMVRVNLDDGLLAFQCPETEGIFLPIASYFRWLGKQEGRLPQLPAGGGADEDLLEDSEGGKLCPESGQLMLRYQVGHGFRFRIDRSPSGSLWFDKGEWEALRSRQFHDELHFIFTSAWQDRARSETSAAAERALLVERLSAPVVGQLDDLAGALSGHRYREMALAYLHQVSE